MFFPRTPVLRAAESRLRIVGERAFFLNKRKWRGKENGDLDLFFPPFTFLVGREVIYKKNKPIQSSLLFLRSMTLSPVASSPGQRRLSAHQRPRPLRQQQQPVKAFKEGAFEIEGDFCRPGDDDDTATRARVFFNSASLSALARPPSRLTLFSSTSNAHIIGVDGAHSEREKRRLTNGEKNDDDD